MDLALGGVFCFFVFFFLCLIQFWNQMVDPANAKQAKKQQKVKHIPECNEGKFKRIN